MAVEAASDTQVFLALYEIYFERVYTYLRYRVDDPTSVEDLCAQVFERLLTRLSSYQPERGDFEPWLFALVRNELRSFWRKHNRKPMRLEQIPAVPIGDAHPEEHLLRRQELDHLHIALRHLDPRSRDLLGLKFGAGLKNRQIAQLTGLSESNVGVLVYRALNKLRNDLEMTSSNPLQEVNDGRR